MKTNRPYGPHLTIDGSGCDPERLENIDTVYQYLEEIPNLIGMKKISHPSVIMYEDDNDPDEWGVTGFVLIATSHISIHTYPAKRYIFIDIFSCKPFNENKALRFTKEYFKIGSTDHRIIERGQLFPR